MANLNDKAVRIHKRKHRLTSRLLHPGSPKAYILKHEKRETIFTVLAVFEHFEPGFDKFRHRVTFDFAVESAESFVGSDEETRDMRRIAEIGTHIAVVKDTGESVVYAINDGDEYAPYYMDFTWKFYGRQVGDRFTPPS